jgi:PAS domain S-box-containing protein
MTAPEIAMSGSYNYNLVGLSVVISVLASYAALDVAGRVTSARGAIRYVWLIGGAVAMGIGIWSMHYVGMLAFRLPVPVQYDWPTVLVSLLAAVLASAIALFVVSREQMGFAPSFIGSVFMGSGIPVMHYTGMAAAHYTPAMVVDGGLSHALNISSLGTTSIIVVTFMALGLTVLTSLTDRRFSAQAMKLESSEKKAREILETALDAFVGMDSNGAIVDWNAQAVTTFGWTREEALGQVFFSLMIPGHNRGIQESGLEHFLAPGEDAVLNKRIEITAKHWGHFAFILGGRVMQVNEAGRIAC